MVPKMQSQGAVAKQPKTKVGVAFPNGAGTPTFAWQKDKTKGNMVGDLRQGLQWSPNRKSYTLVL